MKELIKKRWFVFLLGILIAVIALLIFGLILYCNGYRIVYPEQFETSWDAVSGFAAWFGVVVSVVSAAASFFAIWFAVRVADKQNKIALFEKRHECFIVVLNLLECARWIEKANGSYLVYAGFKSLFGQFKTIEENGLDQLNFAILFNRQQDKLMAGKFLFSSYDVKMLQDIINAGFALIVETGKEAPEKPEDFTEELLNKELSEKAKKLKKRYCKLCQEYREKYLESMQRELELKK